MAEPTDRKVASVLRGHGHAPRRHRDPDALLRDQSDRRSSARWAQRSRDCSNQHRKRRWSRVRSCAAASRRSSISSTSGASGGSVVRRRRRREHRRVRPRSRQAHRNLKETNTEPYRKGSHVESSRGRHGVESTRRPADAKRAGIHSPRRSRKSSAASLSKCPVPGATPPHRGRRASGRLPLRLRRQDLVVRSVHEEQRRLAKTGSRARGPRTEWQVSQRRGSPRRGSHRLGSRPRRRTSARR